MGIIENIKKNMNGLKFAIVVCLIGSLFVLKTNHALTINSALLMIPLVSFGLFSMMCIFIFMFGGDD